MFRVATLQAMCTIHFGHHIALAIRRLRIRPNKKGLCCCDGIMQHEEATTTTSS